MLSLLNILPYLLALLKLTLAVTYDSPQDVREFYEDDPIELTASSTQLNFPYIRGEIPKETFSKLPETTALTISFRVTKVEPGAFLGLDKLETLDLSWNEIAVLKNRTFSGLKQLTSLNLAGNKITNIAPGCFADLESLRNLNLDFNIGLDTLRNDVFFGLISLESLNLNRCGLIKIEEHAFSDLTLLETLSLTYNRLSDFPEFALQTCPNLAELDVSYNRIASIDDEVLHKLLSQLKVMNISENPWVCSSGFARMEHAFRRYGTRSKTSGGHTIIIGDCHKMNNF